MLSNAARPSRTASTIVREVVVEEHEVRRLTSDVGPGLAHRDADVGLAQSRRVVDTVAGHRDHLTSLLQGARDPELLFGRDAGQDELVRRQEGPERRV